MWREAVDREKKETGFNKIAQNLPPIDDDTVEGLEKRSHEFQKILEVSKEERDRVQRMQVIDRAAAAIAAARALLQDKKASAIAKAASSAKAWVDFDDNNGGLRWETDNGGNNNI